MKSTKPHNWSLDIGPVYRCKDCRTIMTVKNTKSNCLGMKYRSDNEHRILDTPVLNRFPNTNKDNTDAT